MALTETEITAGATYTVRFEGRGLSAKRFRDAVNYVKGISRYEGSTASYDAGSRAWTVTLAPDAVHALRDLQIAAGSYDATVERA